MSTRRVPLSSNPNVANSPLRGASALAQGAKQKRSHAYGQREEPYGQPPPLKKQLLENGSQRVVRSPQKTTRSQLPQRAASRPLIQEKRERQHTQIQQHHHDDAANVDKIREWQKEYRTRFPRMVFYFESIQDDLRAKLSKQAAMLGAREERFFSNNITHVVTTRTIPPPEKLGQAEVHDSLHEETESEEQPQTINPSLLLDRSTDVRRRLLLESASRRAHAQPQDDVVRRANSSRNTDVLHKAREMGKKIWHLEKFRRMLEYLMEPDPYVIASYGAKPGASRHAAGHNKVVEEPNLLQLLQHERLNGPSDRDPTVVSRELVHFKGPYIYVYDIDEKQKPIMVREYPKVGQKYEGEWPQFRTVTDGRCPFVEEIEVVDKMNRKQAVERERAAKPTVEKRPNLQPPEMPAPKAVTGKRTLADMQDGHNKARMGVKPLEMFNPPQAFSSKQIDFRPQNAFTSRAGAGRLFAGEPVASGVQPSNITSAIRSQMISSTSGINGAKAGTSKEVHGLQRKVLQKSASNSQDLSSRRLAEMGADATSSRSASLGRATNRKLDLIDEDASNEGGRHGRTSSRSQAPPPKSKRDLKPGYCENCQDKFKDFDEHILSRKHRRFAESEDNWAELDDLLSQLKRIPKYADVDDDGDDEHWDQDL